MSRLIRYSVLPVVALALMAASLCVAGQIYVTINPPSATLNTLATQQFIATVSGTTNTKVIWSVIEPGGGKMTGGLYTAPATAGTYHVKAACAADPNISATAVVTVKAGSSNNLPYRGSVSLRRTCNKPDFIVQESIEYKNLPMLYLTDRQLSSWWKCQGGVAITTSVNNKDAQKTVVSSPFTYNNRTVSISLVINNTAKTYSVFVGESGNINARITTSSGASNGAYNIKGANADNNPLPANLSRLNGTQTIAEPNGAQTVLTWDFSR